VYNRVPRKGTDSISTFPLFFKILAAAAIIFLLLSSLYKMDYLTASDMRTGEVLRSWKLGDGEFFTVKYTHSVQLTPVWETYEIQSGDIVLKETIFQSFGAGLPSTSPYDFEITEQGFRLYNIDMKITDLVYRVGAVRANHILIIREKEYPFLDFAEPTEGIKFKTQKMSLMNYLAKEGFR
jgi:hypothetical protein